jgi:hypothetical protein
LKNNVAKGSKTSFNDNGRSVDGNLFGLNTDQIGGWPIFASSIPTEGAPSFRFLHGLAVMLSVLFDFVVGA